MKKRNRSSKQSPSYGILEPKRLLAGNVQANVQGEHIFIRGDRADNQIRIIANAGKIQVQGINGTSVNGAGGVTVDNSFGVSDTNRVGSEFAGGLRVHMGPGNDSIEVNGIRLNSLSIIYGGTGDDQVNVLNTDFFGTAVVQTFEGDDNVVINNTNVAGTLWALTLDGDDSLTVQDSQTLGSAIIATGDGDDFLRLVNNQHLGTPQLALTQDGDDTVEIINPEVGTTSLEIYTGNGDDEVTGALGQAEIGGNVIIAGQGDIDKAELTIGSNVANRVSVRGFEFNGEVVFRNAREVNYGFATFEKPDDSFFVADFVEFNRTTRLSSIEWLGSYENSDPPLSGDNFVVEIYEGGFVTDDQIGTYQAPIRTPLATFEVGNNANRVDTLQTWTNFDATRKIFSYSADIDFTMSPNKQYWISIYTRPAAGVDFNNDFYILAEDIELDDFNNGAAVVKWPNFPDWYPNTSGKTHFTLRS